MSAQYSLFDMERAAGGGGPYKADERAADSRPYETPEEKPRAAWRGPAPGMRFLKLGLADRSSIIVETKLSMFELSNELRSKAKVALTLADGRGVEVRIQDVAYLENVYSAPV